MPWATAGAASDESSEGGSGTSEPMDPEDDPTGDDEGTTFGDPSLGDDTSTGESAIDPLPTCPAMRTEVDRADDSPLPQIKVMYVLPLDGVDAGLDTSGQICNSVRAWAGWLLERSGGRGLRLDTAGGELDIAFVRLQYTNAQLNGYDQSGNPQTDIRFVVSRIEESMKVLGWVQPDTVYAVYYGGTSSFACGQGAWPPAVPGVVGAVYLEAQPPGYPPCDGDAWGVDDMVPRYLDYGVLHEVLHALGYAGGSAPHTSTSGHVWDGPGVEGERDILYTPPADGGSYPGWGVYSPGGLLLDINSDDYLDHGQAYLPDLGASAYLEANENGAHAPVGSPDALAVRRAPISMPPPPQ